jgi:hypothetical protein
MLIVDMLSVLVLSIKLTESKLNKTGGIPLKFNTELCALMIC